MISFSASGTPIVAPAAVDGGERDRSSRGGALDGGVERALRARGFDDRFVLTAQLRARAQCFGRTLLERVTGDDVDVVPAGSGHRDARQADRTATDDEESRVRGDRGAVDRVQRDRERLDDARVADVDARRQR